ncbi:hypothetical protein NDU88_006559 [Pleurodeles waltl]|uniref:Uncharacterized protein n=1 Tax=Pleurodeles waltl TaxID=8319 RepID=A0AAV7PRP1_PLEWA|nr:hypothetical protein NDU88_006559 [Pleurodeles waltl]
MHDSKYQDAKKMCGHAAAMRNLSGVAMTCLEVLHGTRRAVFLQETRGLLEAHCRILNTGIARKASPCPVGRCANPQRILRVERKQKENAFHPPFDSAHPSEQMKLS